MDHLTYDRSYYPIGFKKFNTVLAHKIRDKSWRLLDNGYCYLILWCFIPKITLGNYDDSISPGMFDFITQEMISAKEHLGRVPNGLDVKLYYQDSILRILHHFFEIPNKYKVIFNMSFKPEMDILLHNCFHTVGVSINEGFTHLRLNYSRSDERLFFKDFYRKLSQINSIGLEIEDTEVYKFINKDKFRTYSECLDMIDKIDDKNNRVKKELKQYLRYAIDLKFNISLVSLPWIGKARREKFSRYARIIDDIVPIKPKIKSEEPLRPLELINAERNLLLIEKAEKLMSKLEEEIGNITYATSMQYKADTEYWDSTTDSTEFENLKNNVSVDIYRGTRIFRVDELVKLKGNKATIKGNFAKIYYNNKENFNEMTIKTYLVKEKDLPKHKKDYKFLPYNNEYLAFPRKIDYIPIEDFKKKIENEVEFVKPRKPVLRKEKVGKTPDEVLNDSKLSNDLVEKKTNLTSYNNLQRMVESKEYWQEVKKKASKPTPTMSEGIISVNKFEVLALNDKYEYRLSKLMEVKDRKLEPIPINLSNKQKGKIRERNRRGFKKDEKNKMKTQRANLNDKVAKIEKKVVYTNNQLLKEANFNHENKHLVLIDLEDIDNIINNGFILKKERKFTKSQRRKIVERIKDWVKRKDMYSMIKL